MKCSVSIAVGNVITGGLATALTLSLSFCRCPTFASQILRHQAVIPDAIITVGILDRFVDWERWNELVRGRRDPTGLFAVEIVCVCTVFDVGNKVFRMARINKHYLWRLLFSGETEQPTPDADRSPHLDRSPHDDSDYV
ncbi:hypothetical protein PIB30_031301 [Stylosanthes scabra]|uniref:Uncharacterized protein n=1 Tax=Stylosanthes scabra TaxID=79078 RepID=A0ABU6QBB3_9FABA|nr:hypothetical protein [Stylosanthes scabra]